MPAEAIIIILMLPLAAPLVALIVCARLWGRPFVQRRWRLAAWYYGLMAAWGLLLIVTIYVPCGVFEWLLGIGGPLFWCCGVVIGLLLPVDPRPSLPLNICRKCGYNLTGNVSGVCPECGQEIPIRQRRALRALLLAQFLRPPLPGDPQGPGSSQRNGTDHA